jgi:hypothetical protein
MLYLWQVAIDADGCPDGKRCRQIGQQTPDIPTGVARRHPPGSAFRPPRLGPGPARAVLGWPAGACWRPQQPKHGLHTPPGWTVRCVWGAWGGLGCLCHSGVAPCSNSLEAPPRKKRANKWSDCHSRIERPRQQAQKKNVGISCTRFWEAGPRYCGGQWAAPDSQADVKTGCPRLVLVLAAGWWWLRGCRLGRTRLNSVCHYHPPLPQHYHALPPITTHYPPIIPTHYTHYPPITTHCHPLPKQKASITELSRVPGLPRGGPCVIGGRDRRSAVRGPWPGVARGTWHPWSVVRGRDRSGTGR